MKFKIAISLVVFFLIANVVFSPTISGLKEDSSSYGNLMIDNDILSTSSNQPLLLKISGEVFNPVSGFKVTLIILKPDSSSAAIVLSPDDTGTFYTNHGINPNWSLGDYSIKAVYQDYEIGVVSFEITDEPVPVSSNSQQEPEDTTAEPEDTTAEPEDTTAEPADTTAEPEDTTTEPAPAPAPAPAPTPAPTPAPVTTPKITHKESDRSIQTISEPVIMPAWIKHNAKWWADDAISDNDFTSGIEFMIKQDIIKVPQIVSEKEKSSFTLGKIPTWVKSNAKWWSEDLISDQDFVKGIEFLIKEGIIRI